MRNRHLKNLAPFVLAGGILIFNGCVKEEFSVDKLDTSIDISPALAAPIGYFDFRLEEMIKTTENASFYVNDERIIGLKYSGEARSGLAGDLFQFDPVVESLSLMNPTGAIIDLFSGPYENDYAFQVPLFLSNSGDNTELDSIIASSGSINISGLNFPRGNGEITITIPGLVRGGRPFSAILSPNSGDTLIDISNSRLALLNLAGNKNLIDIHVHVYFPRQDNVLYIDDPMATLNFEIHLREWDIIYGYIGQESIEFPETFFSTNFENYFPEGDYYFADPLMKVKTINSFGLPLGMAFSPIQAETRDAGTMELEGTGVPVPPDYFYPAYPDPNSRETEVADSFIVDKNNSNLRNITSAKPERILYQALFTSNPGDVRTQNIIYANSYFSSHIDLELPFHGKASMLSISDTLKIDLSQLDIPLEEDIHSILFKIYYENSFPADINLQLYLANESFTITDTLFDSFTLIKGAPPADKFQESPDFTAGEIESSLPGNRIDNVKNARYLIGKALLNTAGERDDVKIFENQYLHLNLGVILDIKTTIEDF